jgi:hypothetical protein
MYSMIVVIAVDLPRGSAWLLVSKDLHFVLFSSDPRGKYTRIRVGNITASVFSIIFLSHFMYKKCLVSGRYERHHNRGMYVCTAHVSLTEFYKLWLIATRFLSHRTMYTYSPVAKETPRQAKDGASSPLHVSATVGRNHVHTYALNICIVKPSWA